MAARPAQSVWNMLSAKVMGSGQLRPAPRDAASITQSTIAASGRPLGDGNKDVGGTDAFGWFQRISAQTTAFDHWRGSRLESEVELTRNDAAEGRSRAAPGIPVGRSADEK